MNTNCDGYLSPWFDEHLSKRCLECDEILPYILKFINMMEMHSKTNEEFTILMKVLMKV